MHGAIFRKTAGIAGLLLGGAALLLSAGQAFGQFNGDFSIERHTLADENFLDWKAYQHPPDWRYDGYFAPNLMRASVGSLSQEAFYFLQEIKLEADLGRYVTFLYAQGQEAFFRPEEIFQEVDLRVGETFYASLIGFPQPEKTATNSGLALAWGKRTDLRFIRYTHLEQFTLFNKLNKESDDKFSPIPVLDRWEVRYTLEHRLFFQADIRSEKPTRLKSTTAPERQTYRGEKIDITLEWLRGKIPLLGVVYSRNFERRTSRPVTPTDEFPIQTQELTWGWLDLSSALQISPAHLISAGWLASTFENRIESPAEEHRFTFRLKTTQIYLRWQVKHSDWTQMIYSFQAGPSHLFLEDGQDHRDDTLEDSTQLKAGVGVVLREEGRYRFFFNTTWDLDLLDQKQWDGGNIQFQMFF